MAVTKLDSNDIPINPFRTFQNLQEIHDNCRSTINNFTVDGTIRYYHLPPLNSERLQENCTMAGTYDYFNNSEISYILTFIGIGGFIVGEY